jgi:hypothetical protein
MQAQESAAYLAASSQTASVCVFNSTLYIGPPQRKLKHFTDNGQAR